MGPFVNKPRQFSRNGGWRRIKACTAAQIADSCRFGCRFAFRRSNGDYCV